MTVVSKIAGSAGLLSSINDIHKTAMIYAKREYGLNQGDVIVQNSIGAQKANRLSYRDASRKNWLEQNNFFAGVKERFAAAKGYCKGLGRGIIGHLPEITLSSLALAIKNKTAANITAIGLGILTVYDFIVNSTRIFEKTDYLKRK